MKRFVSYLYSIYNNQKKHNAGFARIELRTGRNRIDIHLQDSAHAGKSGTVYLFTRKQEKIQGISIGNITFRSNQADFRYEQAEENIGQTPWQILQMNGIIIMIENQAAFLSQWDEQPVDTTKFEVWMQEQEEKDTNQKKQNETTAEKVQENTAEENTAEENTAEDTKMNQANNDSNSVQPELKENTVDTAQSVQNAASTTAPIQQENSTVKDEQINLENSQNGNSNYEQMEQQSTIQTAEIQLQPDSQDWEQTWRYMLRMYPVLNQFAEKDNILCVRIEIKDVRLLPEKYWSVVNNSFLLHGFFNYRYLVFGRIEQNWFIGVPGIYQNQEHVMASIFGFPDFLPQVQKNERGEQPGYWYRILEF